MIEKYTIGVDIGGSHITAGFVGPNLKASHIRKGNVDAFGDADKIIAQWATVLEPLVEDSHFNGFIGIAFPGPFMYDQGISLIREQGKYMALYHVELKKLLGRKLAVKEENIRFINDAASFLQGEAWCGAAKGADAAIGLTLGTGLGTAYSYKGVAVDAALWDMPFKDSYAEAYISTRWFTEMYFEKTNKHIAGVKELADLAQYDELAIQIFNRFGYNLAEFIQKFIELKAPDVVVLGGNIAKAADLFLTSLTNTLRERKIFTPIEITQLGEWSAIIGAASSWKKEMEA